MRKRLSRRGSTKLPVEMIESGETVLARVRNAKTLSVTAGANTHRATGYDLVERVRRVAARIANQTGALRCCTTCRYFLMSGMARDMSAGTIGYCALEAEPSRVPGSGVREEMA